MVDLKTIVNYCNDLLQVASITDKSLNGLQVANAKDITTIAFAVDVSTESISAAAQHKAELLIVHHGLFWGTEKRVTGALYHRLAALIKNDIALYAVHLPLDSHPVLGNNAKLAALLKLKPAGNFAEYHGALIGKKAALPAPMPLTQFVQKVNRALSTRSFVAAYGPPKIHSVGIVSGGGSFALDEIKELGIDVLLTGETEHSAIPIAKELGINVIFAGHYLTETLGLQALASHLKKKLKIPTIFLDIPTGL
jgi:dinuclear metal center YbgI/SA1388 family protein